MTDNSADYEFMNIKKAQGTLKQLWESVERGLTDFNKSFIMTDTSDVKNQHSEETLEKELPKFIDLESPLGLLQKEIQHINRLIAANRSRT